MPVRRTHADHGDACRAANALDIVGDRWSLIVVRELILGPRRFTDLQNAVQGVSPTVLIARVRSLQAAGVIEQLRLDDLGRSRAYVLTPWGRGLENVLRALGQWMSEGAAPATAGGMTPDGIVVAMRTMAGVAPAHPGTLRIALRLYDARLPDPAVRDYRVEWSRRALAIDAGSPVEPAATVTADSTAWSEVLFAGRTIRSAAHAGLLAVEGETAAVEQVVALFRGA